MKRMLVALAVVLAALGAALASGDTARAATLFNCGPANTLPANDDGSTGTTPIGFPVNVFGQQFDNLYVNNNGNLTFTGPLSAFVPFDLNTTTQPIFAGFFTDIDTRGFGSGLVTYGPTTYQGRPAFCATWPAVGEFSMRTDVLNTFQIIMVERADTGFGNFDVHYIYQGIQFDHGGAGVGFSAGTGDPNSFYELPGSRAPGVFLDSNPNTGLIYNSLGSLEPGHLIFPIRSGGVPVGGTFDVSVTSGGSPLANAPVQACRTSAPFTCRNSVTNSLGMASLSGVPAGEYDVTAFAPPGSSLNPNTVGPFDLMTGETEQVLIPLTGPSPPPAGTTFGTPGPTGIPVVIVGLPTQLTTQGCPGGTATYTITGTYGGTINGSLTEGPAGTYTASVTLPFTGPAVVTISIDCPSGPDETVEFNIYIDPSGFVRTTDGDPIVGATVTLYRSDTGAPGSFVQVPDGSAIMSPANRVNPDQTDATGHFGWDTIAGYYLVRATADGCHAPGDAGTAFVETAVLTIPPPVTDIDLRLECAGGGGGGDETAPVIDAHDDVTVNGTSRAGAVVTYTAPTATDDVDGPVSVDCSPASGSQFALGATTVACTAEDAAGNGAASSFTVTVLTFEEQLAALRDALAGLALTGQADLRRDGAVAFLDTSLGGSGWDADGLPATNDAGMNAIRGIRAAFNYVRTPNAELAAAAADILAGMVALDGRIAQARYDEVSGAAGASASRLSQARAHLGNAAAHLAASNLPEALLQYQKAWEVLKNEPPQYGSAGGV